MSLTRRLAAGLPVAGITALAALAFSGAPAAATGDETARVAHPVVMTTPSADGYGDGDEAPTRGHDGYGYGSESPTTTPPTTAPTTTPPTPTASVDTVPPGGESPAVSPSVSTAAVSPSPSESTPGGGVSAGGTLPLTGAPMGTTLAIGALLVAAGAGAVFYSRRKRA